MGADDKNEARERFVLRVKQRREAAGFTQIEMAAKLDTVKSTYAAYEVRNYLPHELILPFCQLTETNVMWLLSGEGSPSIYDSTDQSIELLQHILLVAFEECKQPRNKNIPATELTDEIIDLYTTLLHENNELPNPQQVNTMMKLVAKRRKTTST